MPGKSDDEPLSNHVDIPFDPSYTAARNWTQRLCMEPRIPKVDGFQFVSVDTNPETHYLMKSILLRPVYLPPADDRLASKDLRYLEAYKALCTAPIGQDRWPAQASGPSSPGPFQRGWTTFVEEQQVAAARARDRCLQHDIGPWSTPSIWSTAEVAEELYRRRVAKAEQDAGEGGDVPEEPIRPDDYLTMEEYIALETTKTAANFEGISKARTSKPKREQQDDANIKEAAVYQEGGEDDGGGAAQVEGSDIRARRGMAAFGENVCLAHRFDPATLKSILDFDTAERNTSFVKQLKETPLTADGELPLPSNMQVVLQQQRLLRKDLLLPLEGLKSLGGETLKAVVKAQRSKFAGEAEKDDDAPPIENDDEAPPVHPPSTSSAGPSAYFVPGEEFEQPSDLIKQLVRRFEMGTVNERTGRAEPRPLKRDQALFVTRFASACNAVWEDEQKVKDGSLDVRKRRTFNYFISGQGGSGKTSIVQEICLPAIDALFPTKPDQPKSTLIACAKWSQAENISTKEHRAVSCHRAALLGVQSYENRNMGAKDKQGALRKMWDGLRCFIAEEISMWGPALYN